MCNLKCDNHFGQFIHTIFPASSERLADQFHHMANKLCQSADRKLVENDEEKMTRKKFSDGIEKFKNEF